MIILSSRQETAMLGQHKSMPDLVVNSTMGLEGLFDYFYFGSF